MTKVNVLALTRECQDVDERWVRCGRLAYFAGVNVIGGVQQIYFRCREHKNNDPLYGPILGPMINVVDEDCTFGLGYKP